MTILAAAILTRNGRIVLSRQFLEMTRVRRYPGGRRGLPSPCRARSCRKSTQASRHGVSPTGRDADFCTLFFLSKKNNFFLNKIFSKTFFWLPPSLLTINLDSQITFMHPSVHPQAHPPSPHARTTSGCLDRHQWEQFFRNVGARSTYLPR